MGLLSAIAFNFRRFFRSDSPEYHSSVGKRAIRKFQGQEKPLEEIKRHFLDASRAYDTALGKIEQTDKGSTLRKTKALTRYYATCRLYARVTNTFPPDSPAITDEGMQGSNPGPSPQTGSNADLRNNTFKFGEEAWKGWEQLEGRGDIEMKYAFEVVWVAARLEFEGTPPPQGWESIFRGVNEATTLDSVLGTAEADTRLRAAFLGCRTHIDALLMILAGGMKLDISQSRRDLRKKVDDVLCGKTEKK